RAVDGPARFPVPEDGRLALVRDAERGDVARADTRLPARLAQHAERDPPDLLRVVLDPARTGIVLRELRVGAADDAPLAVEDEDGRPRRPLVDRDDAGHQPRKKNERRRRSPSRMSAWRRSRTSVRRRATRAASLAAARGWRAATSSGSPASMSHFVGSGTRFGVTGSAGSPSGRPGIGSRASTGWTSSAPI